VFLSRNETVAKYKHPNLKETEDEVESAAEKKAKVKSRGRRVILLGGGETKGIFLLECSRGSLAHPSNTGSMRVKTLKWLD
jgi:hypothetical protein